ncbi:septum formation initiator family protein [Acidimicrobiaceae bacterium]|nr:septum formation initiator family protein [Acidimicrobiaceae bacterium]
MIRQNLFSKIMFLITSFIFVFFIFDTWELSLRDYQSLQSQLEARQEHANDLRNEITFIQQKIDDLEDPEKLDIILRQHGYGLPGEDIYIFKVPEPVTPLEETLQKERSKGLLEYVVEFIVGTNSD